MESIYIYIYSTHVSVDCCSSSLEFVFQQNVAGLINGVETLLRIPSFFKTTLLCNHAEEEAITVSKHASLFTETAECKLAIDS